jgi:iron complex transport system ATP-binding protein
MSAAILECAGLGYRTSNGTVLVQDVELSVGASDRLAIIGPNGAGKSTLLRLLAGLLRPTSGQARLEGRPLTGLSPIQRALSIAVVGQTDQPDPRLAVIDYVELGRVPHVGLRRKNQERDIVVDALRRTGLQHMRDRSICSLSGGERQRVQLARAIAQQPKLLFLDEPTNHLDPRGRGELLELIADLGIAIVAVLHDLSLVTPFATSVAVMNAARLRAFGPPDLTLTPTLVREVFPIEVLRHAHPVEDRQLTVFDIPIRLSR